MGVCVRLKNIRVCARCEKVKCRCEFGTYSAAYVYAGWFEFLKSRFRFEKFTIVVGCLLMFAAVCEFGVIVYAKGGIDMLTHFACMYLALNGIKDFARHYRKIK